MARLGLGHWLNQALVNGQIRPQSMARLGPGHWLDQALVNGQIRPWSMARLGPGHRLDQALVIGQIRPQSMARLGPSQWLDQALGHFIDQIRPCVFCVCFEHRDWYSQLTGTFCFYLRLVICCSRCYFVYVLFVFHLLFVTYLNVHFPFLHTESKLRFNCL